MLLVAEPCLGEEEKAALVETIASGWITMGERVRAFERAFADLHGTEDAVAVGSCTAGLHLVLSALGIGHGDEVLVPSLTFVATANAVVYCGATPTFVDIASADVPLIDPADAAARCTGRTRAIIVMHYAGQVADGATWRAFAEARGLLLIEDSAHAVGPGRTGLFGDAAVFSFFGNKNMTTAEGGMVTATDPAVLDQIRQMRSHGMTAGTLERLSGRAFTYDVTMLGYNCRMDDLRAAIGLVQLQHLEERNMRREVLCRAYRRRLAEACPELMVPFAAGQRSAHHVMAVVLPAGTDRVRVMQAMRQAGVQTTVHYPPVHRLSWYRKIDPDLRLPRTEDFAARELTLPLHPGMTEPQVQQIATTLAECLKGAHQDAVR